MRLRFVSYNIHRAIGVDRRFRPERIARILAHHDGDIVLLQEVDEGAPRSREIDLARELAVALGYEHYVVGHNVTLRRGRYGNAILSRYPILRERNIDLTIDRKKRRGCQHASIYVNKFPRHPHHLEVFNLHLGLSALERSRQIGMLVRSKEFAGLTPELPCLVGGDFNDWRSLLHPIFTEILGFDCATQSGPRYDSLVRTYPSLSPRGALDRFYFRGWIRTISARRCRLRASKVASDHLPIVADCEIS